MFQRMDYNHKKDLKTQKLCKKYNARGVLRQQQKKNLTLK